MFSLGITLEVYPSHCTGHFCAIHMKELLCEHTTHCFIALPSHSFKINFLKYGLKEIYQGIVFHLSHFASRIHGLVTLLGQVRSGFIRLDITIYN